MNEQPEKGKKIPLSLASRRYERLRWSAWPCAVCSGGVTAVGYLVGCLEAGSILPKNSPEEVAKIQIAQLKTWVGKCPHKPPGELLLPKLAEGSEHVVLLDEELSVVFKYTHIGTFGESYYLDNNRVNQRNCSPFDYLMRLRMWKKLFQSAPRDLGVTDAGQIVSVHKFISGTMPAQTEVDLYLLSSGFTAVRQDCWLWNKAYPQGKFEIWIGDAREDNFVKTNAGIVPIDIRVWKSEID